MADSQATVTVYSAQWCGFCKMVKAYLASKKIDFKEVNIEEDATGAKWVQEATGQSGIPVTVFSDGEDSQDIVIGFDRPSIDGFLKEYKLA